jgi:2-polyprenyl-3-methyl-5-hydroxy-6-metoxy-1,4-benzoquinol methylase
MIFVRPVPANLGDYYPPSYYSGRPTMEQLRFGASLEKYKIELIKQFVPQGRLLEIGPAYGAFLYCAQAEGFEVEAIELDEDCCKFIDEVLGIRSVCEHDPSIALRQMAPYNVIALWHVIEHLPDPWSTLRAVADALLPGGIAVIAAPNPEAFQFSLLGRYWAHVDAPRHLELIPRILLRNEMESLGLKTVLSTTTDQGSLGWNRFGWEFSLANLATHPMVKHYLARIGTLISRMLGPIEGREGYGSAYTLIFQKPLH